MMEQWEKERQGNTGMVEQWNNVKRKCKEKMKMRDQSLGLSGFYPIFHYSNFPTLNSSIPTFQLSLGLPNGVTRNADIDLNHFRSADR